MSDASNSDPIHQDQRHSSDSYCKSYFEALYNDNSDPWQYQSRWYEKRKREMCLAVLPQEQFDNAIELGCGNGVFSESLAKRCRALLSIDGNQRAVQLARSRLAKYSQAKVIQGVIPKDLLTLHQRSVITDSFINSAPTTTVSQTHQPPFDLIVISEILYYLPLTDIDVVITWVRENLAFGGTLLCCHWRYPIKGFEMTGERVHERLYHAFGSATPPAASSNPNPKDHIQSPSSNHSSLAFHHQSKTIDADFLLDIWQNSPNSVAKEENLL